MPKEGDLSSMITRRTLLKGMGTAFISLSAARLGLELGRRPTVFEEARRAMGGPFRITTVGSDRPHLKSAVKAGFEEVWRLEELMTIYKSESEISRLNIWGEAQLSSESMDILKKSIVFSQATNGAFDVSLGAFENLVVGSDFARFNKQGMMVDLGGIGIGYAVDRIVEALKKMGVKSAIVDGGGEVKSIGSKTDGTAWRVGIRNPFQKTGFSRVIALEGASISTSGNYVTPHIIDPRTGRVPEGLASATIIGKDATTADAMSTAVFVLGPNAGLDVIEKTPGLEGLLVTSAGKIIESSGFNQYTV